MDWIVHLLQLLWSIPSETSVHYKNSVVWFEQRSISTWNSAECLGIVLMHGSLQWDKWVQSNFLRQIYQFWRMRPWTSWRIWSPGNRIILNVKKKIRSLTRSTILISVPISESIEIGVWWGSKLTGNERKTYNFQILVEHVFAYFRQWNGKWTNWRVWEEGRSACRRVIFIRAWTVTLLPWRWH